MISRERGCFQERTSMDLKKRGCFSESNIHGFSEDLCAFLRKHLASLLNKEWFSSFILQAPVGAPEAGKV